ncbi:MAG TPA: hypothetical protein VNO32_34630, partial [Candidatus Acidoferrum sp.]|nr:hypothetical protein [Candidatus Acidoferrum sp.]
MTTRLMMNDDLQDEYDEHPQSREQLTLSRDGLDGCGTFFIVVNYLVDATAHGTRTLDPGI